MTPGVQVLAHASVAKWFSLGTYQASFRLDERSVLSVHLVVESASVAEVVTSAVSSPQRRGSCAAIHTLAALCRCRIVKTTNWLILRCSNASCQREATFGDVDRTNSNGILPPLNFKRTETTLRTKLRPCKSISTIYKTFVNYPVWKNSVWTSSDRAYWEEARARWLLETTWKIRRSAKNVEEENGRISTSQRARRGHQVTKIGDGSRMQLQTYHIKRLPEQKQSLFRTVAVRRTRGSNTIVR